LETLPVWEHTVSDTRKQIEAEITAFKIEIERLKSLRKSGWVNRATSKTSLVNFANCTSGFPSLSAIGGRPIDIRQ